MSKRVPQQDKLLEPVAPDQLEIAKLARRARPSGSDDPAQESRAAVVRVGVWLDRTRLGIKDDPMMFRLKMALIQGLRRRFRYSIIDVDDIELGQEHGGATHVEIEPHAPDALKRAVAVVERVLRWERWRT
jgi:hypothetical protein